jgi:hypothetical protein
MRDSICVVFSCIPLTQSHRHHHHHHHDISVIVVVLSVEVTEVVVEVGGDGCTGKG